MLFCMWICQNEYVYCKSYIYLFVCNLYDWRKRDNASLKANKKTYESLQFHSFVINMYRFYASFIILFQEFFNNKKKIFYSTFTFTTPIDLTYKHSRWEFIIKQFTRQTLNNLKYMFSYYLRYNFICLALQIYSKDTL